jgi:hypothetical protein
MPEAAGRSGPRRPTGVHPVPRGPSSVGRRGILNRAPACEPVLTHLGWRLPFARPGRVSRGSSPSRSRRRLSYRLVGWCGDQLSGLQAATGQGVPPLPSGGAAPRGAAESLARPLCPTAWSPSPGGRAGAARLHEVVLPVVREEAPAPVGGVAPESGASSGSVESFSSTSRSAPLRRSSSTSADGLARTVGPEPSSPSRPPETWPSGTRTGTRWLRMEASATRGPFTRSRAGMRKR